VYGLVFEGADLLLKLFIAALKVVDLIAHPVTVDLQQVLIVVVLVGREGRALQTAVTARRKVLTAVGQLVL